MVITPKSQYLTRNNTECSNSVVLQVSQHAAKCIPAMVCPEVTEQIRREIAASLHQRKGDFACYFLTDLVTFTLPAGSYTVLIDASFSFLSGCFLSPSWELLVWDWYVDFLRAVVSI